MSEHYSLGVARFTTSAIGPNGRTIYFEDPKAPDWFVDEAHREQ